MRSGVSTARLVITAVVVGDVRLRRWPSTTQFCYLNTAGGVHVDVDTQSYSHSKCAVRTIAESVQIPIGASARTPRQSHGKWDSGAPASEAHIAGSRAGAGAANTKVSDGRFLNCSRSRRAGLRSRFRRWSGRGLRGSGAIGRPPSKAGAAVRLASSCSAQTSADQPTISCWSVGADSI